MASLFMGFFFVPSRIHNPPFQVQENEEKFIFKTSFRPVHFFRSLRNFRAIFSPTISSAGNICGVEMNIRTKYDSLWILFLPSLSVSAAVFSLSLVRGFGMCVRAARIINDRRVGLESLRFFFSSPNFFIFRIGSLFATSVCWINCFLFPVSSLGPKEAAGTRTKKINIFTPDQKFKQILLLRGPCWMPHYCVKSIDWDLAHYVQWFSIDALTRTRAQNREN